MFRSCGSSAALRPSPAVAEAWLRGAPSPGAALKLFCFPYAGGGAQVFAGWKRLLRPLVDVQPVYLPGRGPRMRELLETDLVALARAAAQGLADETREPYALFGHSLGALLAFEVALALREAGHPLPRRLIVSASCPPDRIEPHPTTRFLPDSQLVELLHDLDGTPPEALASEELMRLVLPVLRADLTAYRDYRWMPRAPLDCPVSAFAGTEDRRAPPAGVAEWRRHTTDEFALHRLPGGHFFIRAHWAALIERVHGDLRRDLGSPANHGGDP